MTDEQRQEFMRRMNEGMRAMSEEQMAARAAEQAYGMRNAWPDGVDNVRLAQASMNFWRQEGPLKPVTIQTPPTLWERLKRWLRS